MPCCSAAGCSACPRVATIAVLVGARMADQIRRVGLLKAVGGTPSLVAAVLCSSPSTSSSPSSRRRQGWRSDGWRHHCSPIRRRPRRQPRLGALHDVHGRAGGRRRPRGRGRRDLRSCRPRLPHQHRPRPRRLCQATPAHDLADRPLDATPRPAAARPCGSPPGGRTAPCSPWRAWRDPDQVGAGFSAAQVLPALAGAILALPESIALAEALDDDPVTIPSPWELLAAVLGSVLVNTALTAIPARIGARRPAGVILQAERA
jgi:hypothetical protein